MTTTRFTTPLRDHAAPALPRCREVFKHEALRKGVHFLIALTPALAALNRQATLALLFLGVSAYAWCEYLRLAGVRVPVVSTITRLASRERDHGRFVKGPVTLGLGAAAALLLFPAPAAAIAIYALAFGDGLASLVGRSFGRLRPPCLGGKSVEGSLACFGAVFLAAWEVSRSVRVAFFTALVTTLVETLPLEDWDNVALPVAAGIVAQVLL